jgi:molybdenum cofactor synthesis domain-containing protein
MRTAILTISDARAAAAARGEPADDASGDAAAEWARAHGDPAPARALVPDDGGAIVRQLLAWCDAGGRDAPELVLTTGGTGLAPRDVTPEATRAVLEREAPGIAEHIRRVTGADFPRAALSRGLAGTRGRTLVVNLPGSPGGVRGALAALAPVVGHALDVLRDRPTDHAPGAPGGAAPAPPNAPAG